MRNLSAGLVLLSLAVPSFAADTADVDKLNKKVEAFTLKTADQKAFALADLKDKKAVVVVFLSFDCPVSNSYAPTLIDLHKTYAHKKVAFVAVNSSDDLTPAELGKKADPYDKGWLEELARTYASLNDRDKQIEVLKELVPLDADDFDRRVRLAKMLLEAGKPKDAERYARESLHIDVTKKEARELFYRSLREQKKDDELAKVKKLLGD